MKYEVKEIPIDKNDKHIYGKAYILKGKKRPLVILAHGLASSHKEGILYAEKLVDNGYNVYLFDFCGGGPKSKSSGKTTEMSIMTEVNDLEIVINQAKTWDFVDTNNIFIIGSSQGGIVAAIVASRCMKDIKGLILKYPAFAIPDQVHEQFESLESLPEVADIFNWLTVGRIYAEDIWDYDVYEEIKKYNKPTLILHGDKDILAPISYSKKANELYPNSEFYTIKGAGHGFTGEAFDKSVKYILDYLKKNID